MSIGALSAENLWRCIIDAVRREELLQAADLSPLLQTRIKLVAEVLGNCSQIKKAIERHAMEVDWHIQRMYRIRNAIVHGGTIPDDLTNLGSHLATYLWIILRCVLEELSRPSGVRDIKKFFDQYMWLYDRQCQLLDETGNGEPNFYLLLRPNAMLPQG